MRKSKRRIMALLLSFVMVLICMPMSVFADDVEDGWEFSNPASLWPDMSYDLKVVKYDETTGDFIKARMIDATTSDPAVVEIKSYSITSHSSQTDLVDGVEVTSTSSGVRYQFFMKSKAPGEAVITAKYIINGESEPRTMTQYVTVEKYPNHIKSLKVAGKTVKISQNKYNYEKTNFKKTAFNVKLALKKGWKITSLNGVYTDYERDKSFKVTKKMITGKKKISFPKKWKECSIKINMKNGDKTISYYIFVER